MPFVVENTGTVVSASHGLPPAVSRTPAHTSTTGSPSRTTASAAPTSPRSRRLRPKASATLPNPSATSPRTSCATIGAPDSLDRTPESTKAAPVADERTLVPEHCVPDQNDLLPLLEKRLKGMYSPLLADSDATLLLTAGGLATWTVEFKAGRASVHRGGPGRPTTTVRASLPVLADVVSGRIGGVQAFLDGTLTVRGNLSLALQLDGLFPGEVPDDSRTHTRSVRANGLETFYLEAGPADAPPIVLVHGLGATNSSMLPLIPMLAQRYRVIAPDLPGHGGTQATAEAHKARFLGDWLLAFLAKTCDEPAVLIGNSLGGRTALEAALNRPEAVRGLVLLCPAVAFRKLRQLVPVVRLVPDEVARLPVRFPRTVALRGLRQLFADQSRLPVAYYEAAIDEFVRVVNNKNNRLAV